MKLAYSCWSVVALSLAACGMEPDDASDANLAPGTIELALSLGGGTIVTTVSFAVTRNGQSTLSGQIPVSDPLATVSAFLGGIPAGFGYDLKLQAVSTDLLTTCQGQATFDIVAGLTTSLNMRMDCRKVNDRGGVAVTVTTNFCPRIKLLVVSPNEAGYGKSISLNATVEDPDGPMPALLWSATGGGFSNTAIPVTSYTCSKSGLQTITLLVSDAQCTDSMTAKVNCLPCGSADVDKNGVLDCEETLIKNGEFRTDTSGWNLEAEVTKEFFGLDADQSSSSGAVRVSNTLVADSPATTMSGISQCVAVVPGAKYLLFTQAFIPVGQGNGFAANSLFFFSNASCKGFLVDVFTSDTSSVLNTWTKSISRPVAPTTAQSVLVRLVVGKPFRQPGLQVLFDNVLFRRDQP